MGWPLGIILWVSPLFHRSSSFFHVMRVYAFVLAVRRVKLSSVHFRQRSWMTISSFRRWELLAGHHLHVLLVCLHIQYCQLHSFWWWIVVLSLYSSLNGSKLYSHFVFATDPPNEKLSFLRARQFSVHFMRLPLTPLLASSSNRNSLCLINGVIDVNKDSVLICH